MQRCSFGVDKGVRTLFPPIGLIVKMILNVRNCSTSMQMSLRRSTATIMGAERQRSQIRVSSAKRNVSTVRRKPNPPSHVIPFFLPPSVFFPAAEGRRWNASEPLLLKVKPKEGCHMEEEEEVDSSEGETTRPKGKESTELERDVYTFPGDSDPESPPPAPWAQCTFIQRCRKKRVLLRPFSGLGLSKHTLPEIGKLATPGPQISIPDETAPLSPEVCESEGVGFGEGTAETTREDAEEDDGREEAGAEVFTCVECSIYFKKQIHLQEHMMEHCQSGGRRSGKGSRLQCVECGWTLPNRQALVDHHRKHQESRLKILEEIEKLNDKEKAAVAQHTGLFSSPDDESGPETVTSPPSSPALVAAHDADSAVMDLDATTPNSVRSPAQARTASGYRRRFVCTECSFSTKTAQALANHSKTHNRKKHLNRASNSLACGHCAFLTTSPTRLKEHLTVAHSEPPSAGGQRDDETRKPSGSNPRAQISKDSHCLLEPKARHDAAQGATASEETATPDGAASRVDYNCEGSSGAGGRTSTELSQFDPEVEDDGLTGSEEDEQEQDHSRGFNPPQQEADSQMGGRLHSGAQRHTGTTNASSDVGV